MADAITRNAGRDEMAYVGAAPWHGKGQQLTPGADMQTWLREANMLWRIMRSRVQFATSRDPGSMPHIWEDKHVTWRSDNAYPLGVVSKDYETFQPQQVGEFFAAVCALAGASMETMGNLFGGKKFWGLARLAPDSPIKDLRDGVAPFLLLSSSSDGSASTQFRFTDICVVCANTLSAAMRSRPAVSVSHASKVDLEIVKFRLNIPAVREAFEASMSIFRQLANKPMSTVTKDELLARLLAPGWADLEAGDQAKVRDSKVFRQIKQIDTRGGIGSDLSGRGATAWGWLNNVTEWVDHVGTARTADAKLDSALWGKGDGLKNRALDLVCAETLGYAAPRAEAPRETNAKLSLEDLGLA